jgi:hypothetical protein
MSYLLTFGFMFFSCVILLNVLIAQLSASYTIVQEDAQRALELDRARIIAGFETKSFTTVCTSIQDS